MRIGFHRSIGFTLLLALLGAGSLVHSYSSYASYSEDDLKAVYLFRFALLIDWPDRYQSAGKYNYCAYKRNDTVDSLKQLIKAKSDKARFYQLKEDQKQANCHLIFLNTDDQDTILTVRRNNPNSLLVGNSKDFVRNGGMIAFIKNDNRIKPLISRENVADAPFKLRAQLLQVSEIWEGN